MPGRRSPKTAARTAGTRSAAIRLADRHVVGDTLAIAQVLYPTDVKGSGTEGFFNDTARNLFLGLALYLVETPELPRTIGEILRQSSGQGQPIKQHLQRPDAAARGGLLASEGATVGRLRRRPDALPLHQRQHAVEHPGDAECAADGLQRSSGGRGHERR